MWIKKIFRNIENSFFGLFAIAFVSVSAIFMKVCSYMGKLVDKLLDPSNYNPIVPPSNAGLPNGTFGMDI